MIENRPFCFLWFMACFLVFFKQNKNCRYS